MRINGKIFGISCYLPVVEEAMKSHYKSANYKKIVKNTHDVPQILNTILNKKPPSACVHSPQFSRVFIQSLNERIES